MRLIRSRPNHKALLTEFRCELSSSIHSNDLDDLLSPRSLEWIEWKEDRHGAPAALRHALCLWRSLDVDCLVRRLSFSTDSSGAHQLILQCQRSRGVESENWKCSSDLQQVEQRSQD
jgi:hypothetical protein